LPTAERILYNLLISDNQLEGTVTLSTSPVEEAPANTLLKLHLKENSVSKDLYLCESSNDL
jgi:hypothetical protein